MKVFLFSIISLAKVIFREIKGNSFEIGITECGLKKLAHHFDADGLLPGSAEWTIHFPI
ncbi:hypothetical protein DSECCO2_158650 [anaerobic digester metagenome]